MGRYLNPVCRLCRREGEKLFLKGEKCYTPKCPISVRYDTTRKKVYAPGVHPMQRRKLSDYGMQLREKQKLKRLYGLRERQFRNALIKASAKRGNKEENFLKFLEMRLDNAVFRAGLAYSRRQARQLVRHGHVEVNGQRVTIPSFRLRPEDVFKIRESSAKKSFFTALLSRSALHEVPGWLDVNRENLWAKVVAWPKREEIGYNIQLNLVVEYYSR